MAYLDPTDAGRPLPLFLSLLPRRLCLCVAILVLGTLVEVRGYFQAPAKVASAQKAGPAADAGPAVGAKPAKAADARTQPAAARSGSEELFREGRDLIGDGRWDAAAKKFDEFVRRYPRERNADAAYYWLAFCLKRQGKANDADLLLQRLIKEFPGSSWVDDAEAMRVELAVPLGKVDAVRQVLEKQASASLEAKARRDLEIQKQGLEVRKQLIEKRQKDLEQSLTEQRNITRERMKSIERQKQVLEKQRKTLEQQSTLKGNTSLNDAKRVEMQKRRLEKQQKVLEQELVKRKPVIEKQEQSLKNQLRVVEKQKADLEKGFLAVDEKSLRGRKAIEIRKGIGQSGPRRVALGKDDAVKLIAVQSLFPTDPERAMSSATEIVRDPNASPEIKQAALSLIARNGGEKAWPVLVEIAHNKTADASVRENALYWIARLDPDRAVEPLSRAFDGEPNDAVKERLIRALAQSRSDAARSKLIGIAGTEKNPRLREIAIMSLARDDQAAAAGILPRLYDEQTEDHLKERIIDLLSRMKGGGSSKLNDIARTDPNAHLRERAIEGLARQRDSAALIRLYDEQKDTILKERLVNYIAKSRGDETDSKLLEIARSDPDPRLRETAINRVLERSGPDAAAAISKVYDAQQAEHIKFRILDWLATRGGKEGLQKLFSIAKDDSSRSVCEKAVEYLRQSKDPDAAKLLEQLPGR